MSPLQTANSKNTHVGEQINSQNLNTGADNLEINPGEFNSHLEESAHNESQPQIAVSTILPVY
jgi:hypothetical protein